MQDHELQAYLDSVDSNMEKIHEEKFGPTKETRKEKVRDKLQDWIFDEQNPAFVLTERGRPQNPSHQQPHPDWRPGGEGVAPSNAPQQYHEQQQQPQGSATQLQRDLYKIIHKNGVDPRDARVQGIVKLFLDNLTGSGLL